MLSNTVIYLILVFIEKTIVFLILFRIFVRCAKEAKRILHIGPELRSGPLCASTRHSTYGTNKSRIKH